MPKKDISLICDLYLTHNIARSTISRRKFIKYGFRRIDRLIKKLDEIREIDDSLPENYIDQLFNHVNDAHLEKETCNEFLIKALEK